MLQRTCPVLVTAQAEQVLQVSTLSSFLYSMLQTLSLNVKDSITAYVKLIKDVSELNTLPKSVKMMSKMLT